VGAHSASRRAPAGGTVCGDAAKTRYDATLDFARSLPVPRAQPESRDRYRHFLAVPTRWMDNDAYRHVNNVVYYSWFDTVVNGYLVARGALEIDSGAVIGLVVETHCEYFSPIAFPDVAHAGLRVARLGTSSVRYEIGIFRNDEQRAAAQGHFVHVYVDRATSRPVPLPARLRSVLEPLLAA
jgi:acyl-CoA thioester hydrolase